MKESRKSRWILAFGILLISMSLLIFLNLCIGSVRIPLKDTLKSLGEKLLPGLFSGKGAPVEESIQKILWNIRMPRTMAALILGGALSPFRVPVTDLFPQSDRRALCAGYFFRS